MSTSPATPGSADRPVSLDDIRAKLGQIRGVADNAAPDVPETAQRTGLVAAGVVVVVVAFVLGRRRGRKKSTIVEVRRI